MGRLAGFRYRDIVRRLKHLGFEQGGIEPDDFLAKR